MAYFPTTIWLRDNAYTFKAVITRTHFLISFNLNLPPPARAATGSKNENLVIHMRLTKTTLTAHAA